MHDSITWTTSAFINIKIIPSQSIGNRHKKQLTKRLWENKMASFFASKVLPRLRLKSCLAASTSIVLAMAVSAYNSDNRSYCSSAIPAPQGGSGVISAINSGPVSGHPDQVDSGPKDLDSVRPDLAMYTRIDDKADMVTLIKNSLKIETTDEIYRSNHAIYGNLLGKNKIEAYEVYKKNDSDEVRSIIKFGNSLNGYPGVVHGGITALLFDNCFGWLFISMKIPKAMTANLSVNYKRPIFANNVYVVTSKFSKLEGRKLTMESNLTDKDGNVLAESTSLFIVINDAKK